LAPGPAAPVRRAMRFSCAARNGSSLKKRKLRPAKMRVIADRASVGAKLSMVRWRFGEQRGVRQRNVPLKARWISFDRHPFSGSTPPTKSTASRLASTRCCPIWTFATRLVSGGSAAVAKSTIVLPQENPRACREILVLDHLVAGSATICWAAKKGLDAAGGGLG